VENGTATITCDWMPASSTVGWTVLPRCFPVPCPEPMVAEHNSYSPTNKSFVFGDSITYSCDVGCVSHRRLSKNFGLLLFSLYVQRRLFEPQTIAFAEK